MTLPHMQKVVELTGVDPQAIPFDELMTDQQPRLMKGLARDWALVTAGRASHEAVIAQLKQAYNGRKVTCFYGDPAIKGRFHYTSDVSGFNFASDRTSLINLLDRITDSIAKVANGDDLPSFYVGSTDVDAFLPGLRTGNDLQLAHPMFKARQPVVSAWIGTRTTAVGHFDASHNLACCVAGRRRFTLFPPDQISNLYPGPLEPTPGGQVVTMVDLDAPDLERFPNFKQAQAVGQVAEMEPGDVLFYPAMWWHQVDALAPFNMLINYWWETAPSFADTPMNTLLHGLLSLRGRTESEKAAWKAVFDHYLFAPPEVAANHLPEHAHGALSLDETNARRLRALLLSKLNR